SSWRALPRWPVLVGTGRPADGTADAKSVAEWHAVVAGDVLVHVGSALRPGLELPAVPAGTGLAFGALHPITFAGVCAVLGCVSLVARPVCRAGWRDARAAF